MIHTTTKQVAGWRIVAGFCPLITGPLRRLLNYTEISNLFSPSKTIHPVSSALRAVSVTDKRVSPPRAGTVALKSKEGTRMSRRQISVTR